MPKHRHFVWWPSLRRMGPAAVVTSTQEDRISRPLISSVEDGAIHIPKVGRNAFQRCYQLLQQHPRFKERCTIQSNGDNRSMVQWKRKRCLILSNRLNKLWEPFKNSLLQLFRRLSNANFKIFCLKPTRNLKRYYRQPISFNSAVFITYPAKLCDQSRSIYDRYILICK